MNEKFVLSPKYIDFLKYGKASAEFLEGTTYAGKTTVGIPKFMLEVSKSNQKFHILSGLDLGTIEKNIIQKELGINDIFGNLVDYKSAGDVKYSLPHIKFKTPNGEKIIFVLGYDNKARWKKALGGQYGCIFIDEFNIADMEFVREIFMRCDYRIATLNPDDPNKECYTQYVNKSRPIDKYKGTAPAQLEQELKEEENPKWKWWYFNFDDNASLTKEKKEEIISSVPIGTKLYKNKILGLRGKATGLVFNLEKKNIISYKQAIYKDWESENPKDKWKYLIYSIGIDTSYSSKTHDKLTFNLIGIREDKKIVVLNTKGENNKDRTIPFAPSDVIPKIIEFAENCKKEFGFALNIFIDSADSGTIAEAKKYKRTVGCVYNFVPAWKKTPNLTRIQLQQSWLKTDDFLIIEETNKEYIEECNRYSFTEDGKLEDGNDHFIQGTQYAWLPFKEKIGNWELIKKLIKIDEEK